MSAGASTPATAASSAPLASRPAPSSPARQRRILAALCIALFLTMLDNTIVSVTLPNMQAHLSASVSQLQWVITSYVLVFAALLLTGGTLGDLLGRKRVLLAGIVIFVAGSAFAAAAPSVHWLLAARVVQGAGAALSEPGTLSVLRHVYPDSAQRARALGIWAATSGLALAVGPVLGGLLTSLWQWRAVFVFNIPFGLLALVVVAVEVTDSKDRAGRSFDWPGQLLAVASLAAFAYAVIDGETNGYTATRNLALFALAALCAAGFVTVERRGASPMLDLSAFRNRTFTAATLAAFAASAGIFAVFFFLALYLELIDDTSPAGAAARFAPMMVAMIVASVLAGRWTARSGVTVPVVAGLTLAGLGMLAVDACITASRWSLVGALVVVGFGLGTVLAPMTAAVLSAVPPQRSGMAAGVTNVAREVGGLLAVTVLGAVTVSQLFAALDTSLNRLGAASYASLITSPILHGTSPNGSQAKQAQAAYGSIVPKVVHAAESAFVHGLHIAMAIAAGILLAAAVAAFFTMRSDPDRAPAPAVAE